MANEKFTWLELRKAVAQMAGTGEQVTGLFLDSLIDAIIAGLEKDKQVKIKGIGTFSLKPMAARKSVNIATGEDFVIAGYNKLTFNPESSFKENIEKRIETPKTAELINNITQDPLKKLGEQATEIVDILADLGQSPITVEETTPIPTPKVKTKEEPVVETKEEPIVETKEEPEVETKEEPVVETKEEPEVETKEEPVVETKEEPEVETKEEPDKEEEIIETKPTGSKKWIWWLMVIIILLGLGGAGWYYRDMIKEHLPFCYCNENKDDNKMHEEVQINVPNDSILETDSLEFPTDSIQDVDDYSPKCTTVYRKRARRISKKHPHIDPPREYTKFIASERVNKDSRLTWIAKKYYGHKDLWVFIYEANLDLIKDPSHIEIGQYLRIPELGPCCNDINNPETRKLVDELTEQYLNQNKQ